MHGHSLQLYITIKKKKLYAYRAFIGKKDVSDTFDRIYFVNTLVGTLIFLRETRLNTDFRYFDTVVRETYDTNLVLNFLAFLRNQKNKISYLLY